MKTLNSSLVSKLMAMIVLGITGVGLTCLAGYSCAPASQAAVNPPQEMYMKLCDREGICCYHVNTSHQNANISCVATRITIEIKDERKIPERTKTPSGENELPEIDAGIPFTRIGPPSVH